LGPWRNLWPVWFWWYPGQLWQEMVNFPCKFYNNRVKVVISQYLLCIYFFFIFFQISIADETKDQIPRQNLVIPNNSAMCLYHLHV
jgi:hypothetical protein